MKQRGSLKVFFSYADSTAEKRAMLMSAINHHDKGLDIVIGCLSSSGISQYLEDAKHIEQLPLATGNEFDLSAALQRHPDIILLENLAHINKPGCRHSLRRQDVEELLKSGIDVFTTLEVRNIESLNDVVKSITGEDCNERIPDNVFDDADAVEYIDIEPGQLLNQTTLSIDKLNALRELALRRCAERTSRANVISSSNAQSLHVEEHILVCLSPSPSNSKIIRTAARMSNAFHSRFTALYVETTGYAAMSEEDRDRLNQNTRLARQLGAQIETVSGDDVPYQIAEYARLSGVTKIVVGRSTTVQRWLFRKPSLTDRLISNAPDVDIHVIPDQVLTNPYHPHKLKKQQNTFSFKDILWSTLILLAACFINMVFYNLGFSDACIILVYILGVLLTAIATTHQIYSIISAALSVLLFNFIYIEPRFTLRAFDPGYPITFAIMFLAAYIGGTLTTRLKNSASQSAQAAYRTQVLLDTDKLLNRSDSRDDLIGILSAQLVKLLNRNVVVYLPGEHGLHTPSLFKVNDSDPTPFLISDHERKAAEWVYQNNKHAGASTNTFSDARCLYLAIRTNNDIYGVMGIDLNGEELDLFEHSILLSMLGEGALALENEKNIREKEEAAVFAKNEAMRANLLRMISHDLRTPLTSISGNASNLLSETCTFDDMTRRQIYTDIYDDSVWLIGLVENLLSITRIEDGRMQMNFSAELIDEIIDEAVSRMSRRCSKHPLSIHHTDKYTLVRADAKLIIQVIINLIDNAVKYTPDNTAIEISILEDSNMVRVEIADFGNGIPKEIQSKVFDMFYTGSAKVADNRRSMGLGLYLCKAIINAHGGMITVRDNEPHGTIFSFTLPTKEVILHE